jgi:hypothetical protein
LGQPIRYETSRSSSGVEKSVLCIIIACVISVT